MSYIRVCRGLADKGKLVPVNSLYEYVKSHDQDYYKSVYFYSEAHKKQFEDTGTISGITDVATPWLVWDFDSTDGALDTARTDVCELAARLLSHGLTEDSFTIFFSGSKGFSLELLTTSSFSPSEFKTVTAKLAEGLATRDNKIVNPSRLFRVPLTQHPSSGLYKINLSLADITNLTVDQIKELAKDYESVSEASWHMESEVNLPKSIVDLARTPVSAAPVNNEAPRDLDLSAIPKGMPACKYAILNGYFKSGNRHHSLMALGAHLKAQGYPKEIVHRMIKGAVELQEKRNPTKDPIAKEYIWNNIIGSLYSSTWQGKTYSCKEHEFLQENCPTIGTGKCGVTKRDAVIEVGGLLKVFDSYAANFDKNIVLTGIAPLDKKLKLQSKSHVVIAGSAGSGKCLGKDTPVMLYDGRIKMVQDIIAGDLLMGDDSTPRTVLSTTRGREMLYRVKQNGADDYVVNESHILSLRCAVKEKMGGSVLPIELYSKGKVVDIGVRDYLDKSKTFKKSFTGYRAVVEFPSKDLPLPPYLLGYWLGNGTKDAPQFTVHKEHKEVIDYLNHVGNSFGLTMKTRENSPNSVRLDLTASHRNSRIENPIVAVLRELEIEHEKGIPHIYKTSSRAQRLELLAGILDSDGHLNATTKNSYEITLVDRELLEDVQYLCRTLGFKFTVTPVTKRCPNDFEGVYYRGYLNGNRLDDIPVKIEYKKAKASKQSRDFTSSAISVTPIGEGDYYGFEIDGNRRFLLGDCTVTHNTTLVLNILEKLRQQGQRGFFGSLDMSDAILTQKIAQKVTGLSDDELFKMYKNRDARVKDVEQRITSAYDHVTFDFRTGQSIEEVRETLLRQKEKHGDSLRVAIYDYMNLISGPYSDETANLALIAPKLKDLASETDTLIISLAQIARAKGGPATPLKDSRIAKGSSAIEESATVLLGVWREGYNTNSDDFITVAALKTRMGREFLLDLHWSGATSTIRELTLVEQEQLDELRLRKAENEPSGGSFPF